MTTQMDGEKRGYLWNQIRKFHKDLYEENYKQQKG